MTKLEAWLEREKSGLNDFAILERHEQAIAVIEKLKAALDAIAEGATWTGSTKGKIMTAKEALAIDPNGLESSNKGSEE